MEARTLVLTRSYLPHQIVPWTEAVTGLFTGKAEIIEVHASDEHILTTIPEDRVKDFSLVARAFPSYSGGSLEVRAPSVMRLTDWDGNVKRGVKFSRINVFTRDGFRCQYCRKRTDMRSLNYDHVIPRDRGGKTTWDNIVTSCYPCNSRKANRTPQEAGMQLVRPPYKPKTLPFHAPRFDSREVLPSWIPYLGSMWEDANENAA
jgi:5-methylcytosine-specific restriction endonuclease McrA